MSRSLDLRLRWGVRHTANYFVAAPFNFFVTEIIFRHLHLHRIIFDRISHGHSSDVVTIQDSVGNVNYYIARLFNEFV